MTDLPLYTADACRAIDAKAMQAVAAGGLGISGQVMMQRAAQVALGALLPRCPDARRIGSIGGAVRVAGARVRRMSRRVRGAAHALVDGALGDVDAHDPAETELRRELDGPGALAAANVQVGAGRVAVGADARGGGVDVGEDGGRR